MSANYSFFALPAMFVLGQVPHSYGTAQVVSARNGKYNQHNPRGQANQEDIKKTVPQETWQTFERCEAAHSNSNENFPLFAAAVICGNMAKLDPDTLNLACGAFLALRVAYTVVYVTASKPPYSYARSLLWFSSVGICLYLMMTAGMTTMNGGPLPY